ncbi:poly-beta-1,6 N-acetyl-D-glucosamine export porin PgaA [Pusillimonas sp.]|uniref:poly-beta-1,6 N-acetyl-D-glucosamine export porin PgaA n=1 Tax=Pusillimonas sp. TaxID=3040095 RepID=UPI0029BA1F5C|nr:poly-beta-1,6 N-acetyl-D-glucosamine export porin PgaA [Pusillimonas sp.]MDX3893305.1 poly-beta-1,6 N-acetyl-D-glucosamine export porin PgaA [Pusillimonas sp.]
MRRAVRNHNILPSAARPAALRAGLLHGAVFLLVLAAANAAQAKTSTTSQEYRHVIEEARAGRHAWALEQLAEQARLHPKDARIKHDQLIVAGWAGRHGEVIRLYRALPSEVLPLPRAALAAVARAYRDDRQWSESLSLYREGMRRFPRDADFRLGETLVLADSGDARAALDMAVGQVRRSPRDASSLLVLSYAHRLNHQPYAALEAASKAYALAPANASVVEEYVDALTAAGLADTALQTARAHPELFPPARLRALEGDRAAELTRLSSRPSRQESTRYAVANEALQAYDALLQEDTGAPQPAQAGNAQVQAQRAHVDRLIALHSRARMSDVVREYESLQAEGVVVPQYALGHVADAYLDMRQPEKAAELYLQILNAERTASVDPAVRLSHQSGLFYSFVESERFDDAEKVISDAVREQPVWRHQKGTPLPQPNDLSLEASQYAALGYQYADDTQEAQDRLERLVARAPGHSGLRSALAQVYLSRGWPRRAEQELKIAETYTPRSMAVVSEQGKTAMSLQEWRQAEILISDVNARFPENAHVRQLVRDWERHNRAELRISATRGLASDNPVAGNRDLGVDTVVYTPPIGYNWRGFAGAGLAKADFDDYDADYHWFRGGAEWRSRGLTAEAEVSSNHYGRGAKIGARIQGAYDLSDQWQIGGQVAFRSRETPLKALANDITSNRLDAYVRWRANERREWSLTLSPSRFSDGNRRIEGAVAGRERLYTAPHLKLDGHLEVSASHNTHQETPYFNPRADLSVLPSLSLTHTLYRRYDTVLEHRFMLGAGIYAQRGYGSGAIATAGYGIRVRFDEKLEAGISIAGISRPYDGVREREARIMFDLQLRF